MNKSINYLMNDIELQDNDVIVVGNSSGPDSMVLTNILLKIRKKIKIKIICAHVNHNVRVESKEEEQFLKKYCEDNDIVFEHMTIEKYGDDNFHNEARTIRYNFFDMLVKKYEANYLMTAHHADDLMETILMRIVRGTSFKGYGGFKKEIDKGNYKIIRPLIFYTKSQIADYAEKNNIPYRIDKSNFKTKYTRNRYRKVVLPFLKEEDQNVHEKFIQFSNMIFNYEDFVEKESTKYFKNVFKNNILYIDEYKKLEQLLQYKIISKILEQYYQDDLILINNSHILLIQDLINSRKKNSYVSLPNDIVAIKSYNTIIIKPKIDDICDYNFEFTDYLNLPNGHNIKIVDTAESNDNSICRISTNEVTLPLYVRTRKIGDKMQLKKINGSRKVKDIFIDSKISLNDRDNWPIVVDSTDKIIWIPGIKKSKFTKSKNEKYDIILKYQ